MNCLCIACGLLAAFNCETRMVLSGPLTFWLSEFDPTLIADLDLRHSVDWLDWPHKSIPNNHFNIQMT